MKKKLTKKDKANIEFFKEVISLKPKDIKKSKMWIFKELEEPLKNLAKVMIKEIKGK